MRKILFLLTEELSELDFSEMGEAEADHSRDPRKIKLGERLVLQSKNFYGVKIRREPFNSCYKTFTIVKARRGSSRSEETHRVLPICRVFRVAVVFCVNSSYLRKFINLQKISFNPAVI